MIVLGVAGSGTMGSGIAQVAAQQGMDVVLWDLREDLLAAAVERIRASFERNVERGRISRLDADAAIERITTTTDLTRFGRVDAAIEAVLEDLTTKTAVFKSMDASAPPDAILASNTSSLSVAAIAAATQRPDRVVGMHFFNPVPAMGLVEVVRGTSTSATTMDRAVALAQGLGKTAVRVEDTPGFVVNRIVRPFYNEALRLLNDGVASVEEIDRIMKGVGFRMGPFELMDLIGNDINLAVTSSIHQQMYGEPRFRPSFRQERLVQGGNLGQKNGRGWYDYSEKSAPSQSDGPDRATATSGADLGPMLVVADSQPGAELASALAGAGCDVRVVGLGDLNIGSARLVQPGERVTGIRLAVDAVRGAQGLVGTAVEMADLLAPDGFIAVLTMSEATTHLAARYQNAERVCGLGYLLPVADARVIEVAPGLRTSEEAIAVTIAMVQALGKEATLVADGAGLVAPRIVSLIVNEAAHALMEGVASAEDIDSAVRLGANYPHGPLEWADLIGIDEVYAIIRGMAEEFREDRYRPAPLLRKMVSAGWTGRAAGRGFFNYQQGAI